MLTISVSTLWKEVKAGKLPAPVKVGVNMRWRVADLERYVENLPDINGVLPSTYRPISRGPDLSKVR